MSGFNNPYASAWPRRQFWLATLTLFFTAVLLFSHADELTLWFDELWSMFHVRGSLAQVIVASDINWPWAHHILLYGWTHVLGNHDFIVHMLGVFIGMLTIAMVLRLGRQLHSWEAGIFIALVGGTSNYAMYYFLEVRSYGLMLLVQAAFLVVYLAWRQHPTWRRTLWLGVAQAAMLHTQFLLFIVMVGTLVHILFTRPRAIGRWLASCAVTALLFLPVLPQFLASLALRSSHPLTDIPNYLRGDLGKVIQAYSAGHDLVFGVIVILASLGLLWGARRIGLLTIGWLAGWGIGLPVLLYFTQERVPLFSTRYLTFTMLPVFILLGLGLALCRERIARYARQGWSWGVSLPVLILALQPWQPYLYRPAYTDAPPLREFMRAMQHKLQLGDVIVLDPNCGCDSELA